MSEDIPEGFSVPSFGRWFFFDSLASRGLRELCAGVPPSGEGGHGWILGTPVGIVGIGHGRTTFTFFELATGIVAAGIGCRGRGG